MNRRQTFGRFSSYLVGPPWLLLLLISSQQLIAVNATDIKKDDAATAESNDEVVRYGVRAWLACVACVRGVAKKESFLCCT